jgi:hypothetical protein
MATFVTPADYLRSVGKLGPYGGDAPVAVMVDTPTMLTETTDVDPTAVRAWALAEGIEVAAKGRLPAAVVERYRASALP